MFSFLTLPLLTQQKEGQLQIYQPNFSLGSLLHHCHLCQPPRVLRHNKAQVAHDSFVAVPAQYLHCLPSDAHTQGRDFFQISQRCTADALLLAAHHLVFTVRFTNYTFQDLRGNESCFQQSAYSQKYSPDIKQIKPSLAKNNISKEINKQEA